MFEMTGTLHDGVVVPDRPLELPDGTRIEMRPVPASADIGMREDDWPTTPEGVAEHVRRMQTFDPVVLTADEERDIAAWRAEMKRVSVAAVRRQMGLDT